MTTLPEDGDYTLTHAEAAALLGISDNALYARVRRGDVSVERIPVVDGAQSHYNFYSVSEMTALAEQIRERPYITELSQGEIDIAVQLYRSGKGIQFCRRMLGVGTGRMRRILEDYGVDIRPPTRQR